jgi:hypothetical protein
MTRRSLSLLLLLAALPLLGACAGARPRLEGAWECVQPPPAPGRPPAVKILADGRFAFGTPAGDGERPWSGGGTYAYVPGSGTYTETVTYHWARALVGQVITFTCELDGELWHHRATFTADGEPFAIDEVWRRIKVNEPAK